ncbi:hypothetical protein NDU88_010973, partial [Pleurodeles waltl]
VTNLMHFSLLTPSPTSEHQLNHYHLISAHHPGHLSHHVFHSLWGAHRPLPPPPLQARNKPNQHQLTRIINTSISTEIFPHRWKHIDVRPLLKKTSTDPSDPRNYRSISLLRYRPKVLEKAINQ